MGIGMVVVVPAEEADRAVAAAADAGAEAVAIGVVTDGPGVRLR
jgi:phosphoribosylaminoimidazole (AIR) synthetase